MTGSQIDVLLKTMALVGTLLLIALFAVQKLVCFKTFFFRLV